MAGHMGIVVPITYSTVVGYNDQLHNCIAHSTVRNLPAVDVVFTLPSASLMEGGSMELLLLLLLPAGRPVQEGVR